MNRKQFLKEFNENNLEDDFVMHPPVDEDEDENYLLDDEIIVSFEELDSPLEYFEEKMENQSPDEELEITFIEDEDSSDEDFELEIIKEDEDEDEDEDLDELLSKIINSEKIIFEDEDEEEDDEEEDEDEDEDKKKNDSKDGKLIPGSKDLYPNEPEPDPEPEHLSTWEDDRDVDDFMNYLKKSYPKGIPSHNGQSISGCERAHAYLGRLLSEISEAVRKDLNQKLDMDYIEKARVSIMKDMKILKEHANKLKKKMKEAGYLNQKLTKDGKIELTSQIKSEAGSHFPVQLVITPFQRAVVGIIINAVVSGGKPLEDVYEFLNNKYKFTDREELEIIQLLMDFGFPIFKDRGTIGKAKSDKNDSDFYGVDFVKQYFV